MFRRSLRQRRLILAFIVLSCVSLDRGVEVAAAAIPNRQPAQVQTGPIDEPRSAGKKSGTGPVSKGAAAITEQDAKCSRMLIVNANALFAPGRWTLNPDAAETLDVLGPIITKAGKHHVRIDAFTASAGLPSSNQMVAQKRAITARGWLLNHRLVAEGTPVEGFAGDAAASEAAGANRTGKQEPEERVEIVIDTCH